MTEKRNFFLKCKRSKRTPYFSKQNGGFRGPLPDGRWSGGDEGLGSRRGCCVPPKGGGGGEEARGFSTVRGAPQNGDGRVEAIMRPTAQPGHKICINFCNTRLLGVQMSTWGEYEPRTGQNFNRFESHHSASVWGRNWSLQALSVRVQSLTLLTLIVMSPSSPRRLRRSSIPRSKLGTFLNGSRRPP